MFIRFILFCTDYETEPKKASDCPDCGSNAECISGQCRCKSNYFGSPPFCKPECTSSGECPWHLTCLNRRCVDPCPGACGGNARCTPSAHEPRCDCPPSMTGNPLILCSPIERIRKINSTQKTPLILLCFFNYCCIQNHKYIGRYRCGERSISHLKLRHGFYL